MMISGGPNIHLAVNAASLLLLLLESVIGVCGRVYSDSGALIFLSIPPINLYAS